MATQSALRAILSAAKTRIPKTYSATFFARDQISIVDQQVRAFELVHALVAVNRVPPKAHVAIVGAGFTGMTCAVALASRCDCVIHVFESDTTLLRRYRESPFRFVHPGLNTSNVGESDLRPRQKTNFPFMNWTANYAHLVAEELVQKFRHYSAAMPIALHLGTAIEGIGRRSNSPTLSIGAAIKQSVPFDLVILATGFGGERGWRDNAIRTPTNDLSYWASGRPSDYRTIGSSRSTKERVLIVGNGDSGVVELAHYLIRGFEHRDLLGLVPAQGVVGTLMTKDFFSAVAFLHHRRIEHGSETYSSVEGPIGWYWDRRSILERAKVPIAVQDLLVGPEPLSTRNADWQYLNQIWQTISDGLKGYGVGSVLPTELRGGILEQIRAPLADLASTEVHRLISGIPWHDFFDAELLAMAFSRDFDVTIVGRTPYVYGQRQAPVNWFLLGVLSSFGRFKYLRAEVDRAVKRTRHGLQVTLKSPTRRHNSCFDRLVIRTGPDYNTLGYSRAIAPVQGARPFEPVQFRALRSTVRKGRIVDELMSAFRTRRWQRAVSLGRRFSDHADRDAVPNSSALHNADQLILTICDLAHDAKTRAQAARMMFTIRRSQVMGRRLGAIAQLHRLAQAIQGNR